MKKVYGRRLKIIDNLDRFVGSIALFVQLSFRFISLRFASFGFGFAGTTRVRYH